MSNSKKKKYASGINVQKSDKCFRLDKKLYQMSIGVLMLGIAIVIIFVFFILYANKAKNTGGGVTYGIVGGILSGYATVVGIATATFFRSKLTSLRRQLDLSGIHDKFYYFGLIGIILCILPVVIFAAILVVSLSIQIAQASLGF